MNAQVKIAQFEGPFDLLLNLIGEEKLDISEVSLSEVTEQFLSYLDTLDEDRAEELADFLVVAARLLYLKSRVLLPQFSPDDEEYGPSLEDQLRVYKAFVEASKTINRRWLGPHLSVFRIEPARAPQGFVEPKNLDVAAIHAAMNELLVRIKPPKPLPQTQIDKAVSMKERIDRIRKMLRSKKQFSFSDIVGSGENKTEVIVGFLALLELVKQKNLVLVQTKIFSDIKIKRI